MEKATSNATLKMEKATTAALIILWSWSFLARLARYLHVYIRQICKVFQRIFCAFFFFFGVIVKWVPRIYVLLWPLRDAGPCWCHAFLLLERIRRRWKGHHAIYLVPCAIYLSQSALERNANACRLYMPVTFFVFGVIFRLNWECRSLGSSFCMKRKKNTIQTQCSGVMWISNAPYFVSPEPRK